MAEQYDLTTPVVVNTNKYSLAFFSVNVITKSVLINVTDNNSNVIGVVYDQTTTPTGQTVIHSLNTGNFTTTSMAKTILNRLAVDGKLPPGTVSGTPE